MPVRFGIELHKQPFDELARKYCLLGPPDACVKRLAEFVAAGVRTFVIYFPVPSERVLEQLERFGTEILARVPAWVGPDAVLPVAWRT
jgi:alkanesulfonate monooxygenase SsuD/methylene tetrahydromethanopterin reductase-like flavin-dependent oxidoreductase (luciferase family)